MTKVSLFLGLMLFSVSTWAIDESAVSQELPPMDKPGAAQVGDTWVARHSDGSTYKQKLIAMDDNGLTWKDSRGCSWVKPHYFEFEPVVEWADCEGGVVAGKQYIDSVKGSPWPLSNDTKVRYKYRGIGGGYNWRDTRTCEVEDQVRVAVPAGTFDTYKLVCKGRWDERTWWISPDVGDAVAYKRWHKEDRNRRYTLELMEIVRGGTE